MSHSFSILRPNQPGECRLTDLCPDLRACEALTAIFGDGAEVERVLAQTRVFLDQSHKIFVGDEDGSITIGLAHLQELPDEVLYLDIVHELCHVKQHLEGRPLYDRSKSYVDRETEIEAYELTVREARRIGFDEQAIADYLRVPWITPKEYQRLLKRLGVREPLPDKEA